jgi:hypothetical protein
MREEQFGYYKSRRYANYGAYGDDAKPQKKVAAAGRS